ncbi:aspartate aminotransferase family protein [Pseudobacteroides cellulosolvens]|uniref:Acetylornithine aminotransferase n=1 Tax=Pseudobacteroides cellulosolvens ATCC 35603 = DSM 2933 TaxID=398512 RepID=A0A0L6JRC5_9FIRM|nr:acetylornithine/succinylornithine family transaminase [Pseudobacteroides cellulosolvens]KNY28333.1 Acetylornithine/succinyldiaminopimelate aminotransferase [Pseudobacteroides cellulosolvens ATCC 35603 = DSM 2933]
MDKYLTELAKSILFTAARPEIVMECGKGMYLWDSSGKKYLDFIGGWAVTCLGHCPEAISKALKNQSDLLINASPAFFNKPMLEFAQLLTNISCFDRVFFASSGAEANEGAIKLARKYGAKYLNGAFEIITTVNGFHGRTLATMSATGKKHWDVLFEPKVSGFKHVPINDIDAVYQSVDSNTCAIMLEPIQGEGGVYSLNEEYVKDLRKLCDNKGILLIFDEIQTGIGRTGKMFAYEHYKIEPDIMTLAKGIGGGFPLSAMLTKEKLNIFDAGDQGGTYCGQPLAMAVGLAVVNEVINKKLPQNALVQGQYIIDSLNGIKEKCSLKNIRGLGLLIAFDLPYENGSKIVSECLKEGLIINSPKPSTIRLMPPLIVTKNEIDIMIDILCKVIPKQFH